MTSKYPERLSGKIVLVTGATGLIGTTIIKRLLAFNEQSEDSPIQIIAAVRNEEKARRCFEKNENLRFWVNDICTLKPESRNINFIIHAASQTASKSFVTAPIETIKTAIVGTRNVLELARQNPVEGVVYLSSMEVYGSPTTDKKIMEDCGTSLDSMTVRSCYPESKRMCECLCSSYAAEYGIPAKAVRLTQTFGPGVDYSDGRVFAEFARNAIEGKDIILHTKGETKRSYLYTEDAVEAILTVLLKGCSSEAYNAANEATYCSIYEMACLVAEKCSAKRLNVIIRDENDSTMRGYAPTLHMNLDTSKLQGLGWKPTIGLEQMYNNMIESMKHVTCKNDGVQIS
ncbi:MAG: NAD(P)-dependent oxidoreductase [Firmicutes bacterium]|nr:NAD(P)-dependent oxidoreductase [Bacillota bacterium]